MDRPRGSSLALLPVAAVKPDGPRLRKKLQKAAKQQQQQQQQQQQSPPAKRPGSGASNEYGVDRGGKKSTSTSSTTSSSNNTSNSTTSTSTRNFSSRSKLGTQAPQAKPSLPLSPDLSDAKWLDYIRRSGYLLPLDSSAQSKKPPASRTIPINIFPELAHLDPSRVAAAPPRGSPAQRRLPPLPPPSPPSQLPPPQLPPLPPPPPPPHSIPNTVSMMKRRAKTPVFSIGQLEEGLQARDFQAAAAAATAATTTHNKTSSVELIAEQYRALLESRNSMLTDSHSEPPPSRDGGPDDIYVEIRRNSSDDLLVDMRHEPPTTAVGAAELGCGGDFPTSEDETLVSFEEETVYFKPVSFSPEPLSPAAHNHEFPILGSSPSAASSTSSAPDSLSLQICLDLLTRELFSASRGSDASALQIWVMIEAYERLRDQLLDARLRPDELQPMVMMFDMWLRALYTIHDSLTGDGRTNDSDYEALESEDLD